MKGNFLPRFLLCGCGKRQVKSTPNRVIACDIAKEGIIESKKNRPENIYCIADITKLPFKNATFNEIICTEVLEPVSDPLLILKGTHRVLTRGGKLRITVPTIETEFFFPSVLCIQT